MAMRPSLGYVLALLVLCIGCNGPTTSPVAPNGTTLRLTANPTTIAVNGSSNITVIALRSNGVPARDDTEVFFTTTLGTIESRVRTNADGIAQATLKADGRTGTATVKASSGSNEATPVSIVIGAATPAVLKADFTPSIGESLTVAFEDKSEGNPSSWEWDFGDGGTSQAREPSHTYSEAGSYLVILTVRNADSEDSVGKRLTVPASESQAPIAGFTFATSGLRAVFSDTSTNHPTSWVWSFGDGNQTFAQNPTHDYTQPGIYSVTLEVRNVAGSSTASKPVTVPSGTLVPVASFQWREDDGRLVRFRDTSTNNPTSWVWNFGDGTSESRERNPSHAYASTGSYTVSLTAGNFAGSTTATDFVNVRGPLKAEFEAQIMGLTVSFTDHSSGEPATFQWTFGDGTGSTERNPSHTYLKAETYTVALKVTRVVSGGTTSEQSEARKDVTVRTP